MTDDKPLQQLQGVYTMAELARLLAISRKRVRLLLNNAGIASHIVGSHRMVWVADVQEKLPAMWASLVACERMRAMAGALEEIQREP